jgi:hypothetical protein
MRMAISYSQGHLYRLEWLAIQRAPAETPAVHQSHHIELPVVEPELDLHERLVFSENWHEAYVVPGDVQTCLGSAFVMLEVFPMSMSSVPKLCSIRDVVAVVYLEANGRQHEGEGLSGVI